MKLSEEMAVRLHRMMWWDMQKELGNNPSGKERAQFKFDWIHKHFPSESIANDCWLCEYASSVVGRGGNLYCVHCPIKWPNCHCNTLDFSYEKEPISEILALPAKNGEKCAIDSDLMTLAYCNAKMELAKASGLSEAAATIDHIAEIKKKEDRSVMQVLENFSGLEGEGFWVIDHVKKIQEKAVEDYFKKTPGAKLATMDVDQAFKQYADEQKAPIFHALAKASGLSAANKSVNEHISKIKAHGVREGRLEVAQEIYGKLAEASGLHESNHDVQDHIGKIIEKARDEEDDCVRKFMAKYSGELWNRLTVVGHVEKIKRDANAKYVYAHSLLEKYKNALSDQSGLDRDKPINVHLREIVKNSMEAGATDERERIQEKIEELLS